MTELAMECAPLLDAASARVLVLDQKDPLTLKLPQEGRCAKSEDGSGYLYVLFALPATSAGYQLDIDSVIAGNAQFAPRVELLGVDRRSLRTIGRDAFTARGNLMRTTVFVATSDAQARYLLVRSDNTQIGHKVEGLAQNMGTAAVPVGLVSVPIFFGNESKSMITSAYNGVLRVRASSGQATSATR